MKIPLKTSATRPVIALPPILHGLNVVAAAVISRNGILEEANPGFLRVLPNVYGPATQMDVRGSFINPRFDQFAAKGGNSDDGAVYQGVINIGDPMGAVRSLRGKIFALGEKLLIVAEPDIAALEKSVAALEMLNARLSGERHDTTESKEPHGERSSSEAKSFPRPIATAPKAPPSIDPTSGTTSSAQIPVDVAIALLRIGNSPKIR